MLPGNMTRGTKGRRKTQYSSKPTPSKGFFFLFFWKDVVLSRYLLDAERFGHVARYCQDGVERYEWHQGN